MDETKQSVYFSFLKINLGVISDVVKAEYLLRKIFDCSEEEAEEVVGDYISFYEKEHAHLFEE